MLAALAILAGAAWLVYSRAIDAPFVFDDTLCIAENPSIVSLWPLIGDAKHRGPLNPRSDLPTSGRPLVNLSLAINYHFGQIDPAGYHVFNLMVHVLAALLLMGIVRRTLCLDFFPERFQRASGPLAFVIALLWVLHPLQTEAVVYITQRTELMVGLFYLATLYTSLRYWVADSPAARKTWLALAILVCLAGMACKEVMVTAPVIVLLFERTFLTGSFRKAWHKSWPLYVGLFLSWGLLLYLNYSPARAESAGFHLDVPAGAWWFTQTKVFLTYLRLTVWPWPQSIHYEIPYLTTIGAAWPWLLPVSLLGIVTLVLLARRSAIGFVGAWVFLILSPTSIVPIATEVAAERRMYLPSAAIIALLVVGAYWLIRQTAQRLAPSGGRNELSSQWPEALAGASATILIVVLSVASANRLDDFRDPVRLWQNALAFQPDNAVAHNNLGIALADAGRGQEAIEHFHNALRLKPDYADAHYNLGIALAKSGQLQEAIDEYLQTLEVRPNYIQARGNLAIALALAGRAHEAIDQFQLVLQVLPDQAKTHYNFALTLAREGRLPEAMEHYEQALRLKPDYTQACANLARAYAGAGRIAEARTMGQKAVELARAQGQSDLAQSIEGWLTAIKPQHVPAEDALSPSAKAPTSP